MKNFIRKWLGIAQNANDRSVVESPLIEQNNFEHQLHNSSTTVFTVYQIKNGYVMIGQIKDIDQTSGKIRGVRQNAMYCKDGSEIATNITTQSVANRIGVSSDF